MALINCELVLKSENWHLGRNICFFLLHHSTERCTFVTATQVAAFYFDSNN